MQILGERVREGKREILVHSDGYAQSADEWMDARQVDEEGRLSTWMITSPPDHEDYLLTINSDRHAAHGLAVDFRVKVSELNISLNELELGEHRDWEVGIESVSAPNNGEAFHTIEEKNQSMGFFTLGFTTTGAGGRDYFYPTCHLPHKRYSVSSVGRYSRKDGGYVPYFTLY